MSAVDREHSNMFNMFSRNMLFIRLSHDVCCG
jgi:hypothetical protein